MKSSWDLRTITLPLITIHHINFYVLYTTAIAFVLGWWLVATSRRRQLVVDTTIALFETGPLYIERCWSISHTLETHNT